MTADPTPEPRPQMTDEQKRRAVQILRPYAAQLAAAQRARAERQSSA